MRVGEFSQGLRTQSFNFLLQGQPLSDTTAVQKLALLGPQLSCTDLVPEYAARISYGGPGGAPAP